MDPLTVKSCLVVWRTPHNCCSGKQAKPENLLDAPKFKVISLAKTKPGILHPEAFCLRIFYIKELEVKDIRTQTSSHPGKVSSLVITHVTDRFYFKRPVKQVPSALLDQCYLGKTDKQTKKSTKSQDNKVSWIGTRSKNQTEETSMDPERSKPPLK